MPTDACVFRQLRALLEPYAPSLDVTADTGTEYSLNTHHILKNKRPLFFGAVKKNKTYVSFHLMPVYVQPALLRGISPDLSKRMQGKSCFNFKTSEPALLQELANLTAHGYRSYQEQGFVQPASSRLLPVFASQAATPAGGPREGKGSSPRGP